MFYNDTINKINTSYFIFLAIALVKVFLIFFYQHSLVILSLDQNKHNSFEIVLEPFTREYKTCLFILLLIECLGKIQDRKVNC